MVSPETRLASKEALAVLLRVWAAGVEIDPELKARADSAALVELAVSRSDPLMLAAALASMTVGLMEVLEDLEEGAADEWLCEVGSRRAVQPDRPDGRAGGTAREEGRHRSREAVRE